MLKEIHEQPEAIRNTLRGHVDPSRATVALPELALDDAAAAALRRVTFIGCGTSWHAGLVARTLVERLARIPAEADIASEFRYREPLVDRDVLVVPISQSGETADTLAAARLAREYGAHVASVCNVVGSSLARESDSTIFTRAGLEIGVASTKAFTAQIVAGLLLALRLGEQRGTLEPATVRRIVAGLATLPDHVERVLADAARVEAVARRFADRPAFLFLGRASQFPVALEGALKLKEISYVHAEGYPAGEIKHGPIALVEPGVPIVVLAPRGATYDKTASNIEEVRARGGTILAVGTEGDTELAESAEAVFSVPDAEPELLPILTAIPLQLLAYHVGVERGCDVDKPRNLAKSVTVE
jgi:glucosamine--fructose-6-phosphate aminotransferase (isomerizing)